MLCLDVPRLRNKYERNIVKLIIEEKSYTQCVMNTTKMSEKYVLRQSASQMRQLDRNVVRLYAIDATQVHQFGDQDVVKLYERKASHICAKATVMSLNYILQRCSVFAS